MFGVLGITSRGGHGETTTILGITIQGKITIGKITLVVAAAAVVLLEEEVRQWTSDNSMHCPLLTFGVKL